MAPYFSWTRAAYVFFVLAVLAALLRIGGAGVKESRALAFNPPSEPAVAEATGTRPVPEETQDPAEAPRLPAAATAVERDATSEEPPVFYRPAVNVPRRVTSGTPKPENAMASSEPACDTLSDLSSGNKAVFPLAETYFDSYDDTWGAPRPQGGHEGSDLMSPAGTPEFAVTDGTIVPVSGANGNGWNTLGGYTVMLRADYDVGPIKAGDLFYYAHMQKRSELEIGTRVRAGQVIGYAGDTGQGPEVTTGLFPPHLHLGWYDASGVRTSLDSGAMNPYPLLEWLKTNGGAVKGGSDVGYCEAPWTGPPVPSSGGDTWPYPTSPGERPDIDTGTEDARPSPVAKEKRTSVERAIGVRAEAPVVSTEPEDHGRMGPRPRDSGAPEEDRGRTGPGAGYPGSLPDAAGLIQSMENPDGSEVSRGDLPMPVFERPGLPGRNAIDDWISRLIERISSSPGKDRTHPGRRGERGGEKKDGSGDREGPRKNRTAKPERSEATTLEDCGAPDAERPCAGESTTPAEGANESENPESTALEPETTTSEPVPPEEEPAPPETATDDPSQESTTLQ